jgi:hypothetical protein
MIKTPLLIDFYETWVSRALKPVSLESLMSDEERNHLTLVTRESVEMTYHQVEREELAEGRGTRYEEHLTLCLEKPGTMFVHDFVEKDGQLYHSEMDRQQDVVDSEYSAPAISVKSLLEAELNKKVVDGLLAYYDQFIEGNCDYIYFLTQDRDSNYNLAYFTEKAYIDMMKQTADRGAGMKRLFETSRSEGRKNPRFSTIAEAVEHLPDSCRIGLLTTEWLAGKLIQKAQFDEQALLDNMITIGSRELKLMGHGSKFTKDCIDYIFTANRDIYRLMAEKKQKECRLLFPDEDLTPEQKIEKAIIFAETSDQVMFSKQVESITRQVKEKGGISDELMNWLGSIESIRQENQQIFSIYYEYQVWRGIKESIGLDFEGSLNDKALEPMRIGLKQHFVRNFRNLCSSPGPQHRMLLYIGKEEEPEKRKDRNWKYKHVGTRNMIIDLGQGSSFGCLEGSKTPEEGQLESFYDENKQNMSVWLFRGGLLRQMLEKILPDSGTIAVDTCRERIEELVSFCDIKDRMTINYRGVDMVLVNKEALSALRELLGKSG